MEKYANVPITYKVESILELMQVNNGLGGIQFIEKRIEESYIKDYDDFGSSTTGWHKRFDTSNWASFAAIDEQGEFIGGATIAYNTDNVNMLEGRNDISVLWDFRIHPDYRRKGIGKALFSKAAEWSKARDCIMMKIETQNINVNACRFYSAMGCRLGGIKMHAYKEEAFKDEVMLFWYLDL